MTTNKRPPVCDVRPGDDVETLLNHGHEVCAACQSLGDYSHGWCGGSWATLEGVFVCGPGSPCESCKEGL